MRLAAFNEWLEYVEHYQPRGSRGASLSPTASQSFVQRRIQRPPIGRSWPRTLRWPERTAVPEASTRRRPICARRLRGEAVLTLGAPIHEWRTGQIDAVVSVGPLECMPNKIAEAQFFHVAEQEGLLNLTLSLNGEPVAPTCWTTSPSRCTSVSGGGGQNENCPRWRSGNLRHPFLDG